MEKEEVIFEVLEATGLNWTVNKRPQQFEGEDGSCYPFPDNFTLVRNDTNEPIYNVSKGYQVLQNAQLVDNVYEAGKELFSKDLEVEHPWNNAETLGTFGNMAGGSLKGGRIVFAQLELPTAYIGKSDIKRFLTATNFHGGGSIGYGSTNQVICCANTFAMANREVSKIRHSAGMEERLEEAVKYFRRSLKLEEQQMEIFDKASSKSFNNKHVRQIMDMIFGEDTMDKKDFSEKTKEKVLQVGRDIDKSIDEQGETLWALFNGVTRYTNHSTDRKDKAHSLMFGDDATINKKAFQLLEEWVN